MATITIEVTSVLQTFPAGTVEEQLLVEITDPAGGGVIASRLVTGPGAIFTDISAGSYFAEASKNGVTTGKVAFTVAEVEVTFTVPSGLTVTVTP